MAVNKSEYLTETLETAALEYSNIVKRENEQFALDFFVNEAIKALEGYNQISTDEGAASVWVDKNFDISYDFFPKMLGLEFKIKRTKEECFLYYKSAPKNHVLRDINNKALGIWIDCTYVDVSVDDSHPLYDRLISSLDEVSSLHIDQIDGAIEEMVEFRNSLTDKPIYLKKQSVLRKVLNGAFGR